VAWGLRNQLTVILLEGQLNTPGTPTARRVALWLFVVGPLLPVSAAPAAVSFRIHDSAQVLSENIRMEGARMIFTAPDRSEWDLVTTTDDPAIQNPGSGTFCPPAADIVAEALEAVSEEIGPVAVDIYILPFPRRNLLTSSAGRGVIYLSPGVYPYSRDQVHALVVHELGHVVHLGFLPETGDGWVRYRTLRGITDLDRFNETAAHRDRPHEIFAEDFRVLFGGLGANYSGTQENGDLADPWLVPGLREFMVELTHEDPAAGTANPLSLEASPNPFRPTTTIHFNVIQGGVDARLDILAIDGRLVRRLVQKDLAPGAHSVTWDGRDERGLSVAAGMYFVSIRAGSAHSRLKLVRSR
jgi:hypothetical protein